MSTKITMPQLSPTMTKGIIANWFVKVGDEINIGDLVVEVETDKVSIEIESDFEGVVAQLLAQVGDEVAVDADIVRLVPVGTEVKPPEQTTEVTNTESAGAISLDAEKNEVVNDVLMSGSSTQSEFLVAPITIADNVKISPVAKRMALQNRVNLTNISGTGAAGKIVKADIDKALNIDWSKSLNTGALQINQSKVGVSINYDALPQFSKRPITSMRNVVASRLTESSKEIPHFYMSVDCNIDQLLMIRRELNDRIVNDSRISVNDLIVKATAKAFKQVPEANVMWAGDAILLFDDVDISIAVAVDDGLITPVLRKADKLSIAEISSNAKGLVDKARDGQLSPEEYQGGTFTISNLGMYGIKDFTSIINPPQCGILSVGVGEKRAVVIDEQIAMATMMTLTLAMDHRCVDGAIGAKYLQVLKHLIEDPMSLLL